MSPPEWYNKTFPYIWHPLKGMSLSATIFMVIAVSAERFRAVCYPMSRHHVSNLLEPVMIRINPSIEISYIRIGLIKYNLYYLVSKQICNFCGHHFHHDEASKIFSI